MKAAAMKAAKTLGFIIPIPSPALNLKQPQRDLPVTIMRYVTPNYVYNGVIFPLRRGQRCHDLVQSQLLPKANKSNEIRQTFKVTCLV
jgi:hypothetical protein